MKKMFLITSLLTLFAFMDLAAPDSKKPKAEKPVTADTSFPSPFLIYI